MKVNLPQEDKTRGTRWKMLTREEIDFHKRVISELCAIRKAMEKMACAMAKAGATEKDGEKQNELENFNRGN